LFFGSLIYRACANAPNTIQGEIPEPEAQIKLGFPIWFFAHTRRGLLFVILVIFVLLQDLQVIFPVRHRFFPRRGRCFDGISGSNAWFLPDVNTPPP
jgi:hypothetical protein